MAAPPAAHLEQFAAASNRIGDPGPCSPDLMNLGAPYELPHVPFMAGEPMRRAIGFIDAAGQRAMRLLGCSQLANVVPAITA